MKNDKKPQIRFKGFNDDWEQRKFYELVIIERGGSPRPIDKYITKDENGLNWVKIGDAPEQGNYIIQTTEKIKPEGLSKTREVHPGDLILSNSMSFGRPYIMAIDGCIHDGWLAIRDTEKRFDLKFLCTLLGTDSMLNQYNARAAGSTVNNLNKELVGGTIISFPTNDEQVKIGEYFNRLDHLITLHQRKCEMLKKIKKSMLEKMFPKNGTKKPEIRFKGFNDDWEQRKLEDNIVEYTEVTIENNQYPPLTSSRKGIFLQTEYFAGNQIASDDNTGYNIVPYGYFTYRHMSDDEIFHFNINDIVENGIVSTLYPVFTTDENLDSRYLQYQLNYGHEFAKFAILQKQGGSRTYMYLNKLKQLYLTMPKSVEEQKAISAFFMNIDHLITLHRSKQITTKNTEKRRKSMNGFNKELEFEEALITALQSNGWEKQVIKNPTEEDLIQNWANILFENNREIDRLNDKPLIREEMDELIEQIKNLRTPLALNGFINGKTVSIIRKNPEDTLHYGKEVSLKIYDRMEIAAGQSRYQIVEQPIFKRHDKVLQDRRGDIMLLINGMPVFHIELKKTGIPVSEATNQIMKYAHEGVFTGIFSLVQIFFAMNPEETLYFANPGPDGKFNSDFFFHWADFNNEPINDWRVIASTILSIPLAHQLVGFYTVADDSDGVLKVMRSYQYYAANRISDCVSKKDWKDGNQLGGYIWHTTGSGKTMTSFKSAQLIANSKDADKVVFLMDRIELGTQSLKEYRAFADDVDDVQETEDTIMLIGKLKSIDPKDTLIVSSIQKMSNIKKDAAVKMRAKDLEEIQLKRIVFIIDECHRSTFGEMLSTIKETFSNALFFGFTGTPVFTENEKVMSTTADIFGNELHRYSIADGIRDKNVLGFDPSMVMVYKDKEIRNEVALYKAKAESIEDALGDPEKSKVYYHYMSDQEVSMADTYLEDGTIVKGIESYIPNKQYETNDYQYAVIDDITNNWLVMSRNNKFHGIFATSSIPEAISYYKKFKERMPQLKVTGIFDSTIDNAGGQKSLDKEDGLKEMLEDYNNMYGQHFDIGSYATFKKDASARLAHKKPYEKIKSEQQLNLLIVVNQMLTGFDSKWINTLYLDKILVYQNLIQAFSRTNRLFNINEKPFGSIRYYRKPHTMKKNIELAVKLYSGDRPAGLFADHLPENVMHMNLAFKEMMAVFEGEGIDNLEKLPDDTIPRAKFAKLFRQFSTYLQAAEIQGFNWKDIMEVTEDDKEDIYIKVLPTEEEYNILLQRYKELRTPGDNGGDPKDDIKFEIDPYLTELKTEAIDYNYMNTRFEKWLKALSQPNVSEEELNETLEQLHNSFAFLSQEDQKMANLFLHDVQTGDAILQEGLTLQDYIYQYSNNEKRSQITRLSRYFGVDINLVTALLNANVTKDNINEYGRFDALKASVIKEDAQKYFALTEGEKMPMFKVNNKVNSFLEDFILSGGKDIEEPENWDK